MKLSKMIATPAAVLGAAALIAVAGTGSASAAVKPDARKASVTSAVVSEAAVKQVVKGKASGEKEREKERSADFGRIGSVSFGRIG